MCVKSIDIASFYDLHRICLALPTVWYFVSHFINSRRQEAIGTTIGRRVYIHGAFRWSCIIIMTGQHPEAEAEGDQKPDINEGHKI
jgi:hypothetical protein